VELRCRVEPAIRYRVHVSLSCCPSLHSYHASAVWPLDTRPSLQPCGSCRRFLNHQLSAFPPPLHTAYSTQPVRAGVNNSCAPCCNWCHHFNLSWLELRAAYRVTRGGITHCRAQWAATPDQGKLSGCLAGWMGWLSPGLPFLLTLNAEVMTECIPGSRLAQVSVSLAFSVILRL